MKIQIVKVGKPADKTYLQLAKKYETRLKSFCKLDSRILKAQDGVEKSTRDLLAKLDIDPTTLRPDPGHVIYTLDERGRNFSSPDLAKTLRTSIDDGRVKTVSFVIGGPYGVPEELKKASQHVWSLSNAVFPSDMAWVMVWEQVYRASTIIRGTSYHHA
ncbi:23S rRNA (pseudouridine(1915)-N(3))-methyltransferase RlmH [Pseudobacteriovorax antillogorgiicola]|uniref:Ribosomal RNA large subunit methyltransferase H n=1 Tax=Pseudobacteriovorax antillogorgiicola TaxID=1513793 RepID=A0A1Y6CI23_9BACT|nr:23S rRNA (pseudouridine(1915)-N(3))-methyltransferase RlmH [Pseudobacteriovorax antillogorgiicola]TCS46705.1 23S rRNA (pseudouridine1915-N3)-methyltransferase [Pseudobacteriovorax antillogorgiicola]SMF66954.1 23S rRNA (pseudouridine1915-N3)-methyltransferase [Pseudobacteriovorax antillogorgiicola]